MIRELARDDIPAVVAACSWLFASPGSVPSLWDPAEAAGRLSDLLGASTSVCFVADVDGALAGFCTAYLDLVSVRMGQRAWLNELAVDPARRSQGIGKALLDAGKDWARAHGATHLLLDSATARLDAHRFYVREQPSWQATCFAWQLVPGR